MAGNVASLVSPGRDPVKIEQVSQSSGGQEDIAKHLIVSL